jgi:hypothetical protein
MNKKSSGSNIELVFDKKHRNIYGWVEWIILDMLTFSFCTKMMPRKYTWLKPICYNTFMKYLAMLSYGVEKKIKEFLPRNRSHHGWMDRKWLSLVGIICCVS